MRLFSALIALIFCSLFCQLLQAQVDPDLHWRQVRLGNFVLVYDSEHQELAEIYASRLLRLEKEINPLWPVVPAKVTVVLNDRTDLTNGYATFLPYPLIMLYPVLPSTQDSIGEFDDWAWELLVHEYTHVLSFEQRRGLAWGLSYIFGSILTPNALLPRWWLEGVAVENETRYSRAGRLRSETQAGVLRAMELEDRLGTYRYAEINETSIPTWPYGNRPYLFGSLMWSQMVALKGMNAPGELHYRTGGRVPYLLETPVREYFDGLNQHDLFVKSIGDVQSQLRAQVKTLEQVPLTKTAVVDPEMVETQGPAISPDGLKLAYISKNETLKRRIQILVRGKVSEPFGPQHRRKEFGKDEDLSSTDPGSGSPIPRLQEDAPPGGNINRLDWHPDSQVVVYDQVSEKNRFHEYSNLWRYFLKTGKSERLTTDSRAREPTFSPSGERIVYVLLDAGRTHIAIYDMRTKTSSTLVTGRNQSRASSPVWLSENEILYGERVEGEERAFVRNIQTSETRQVLENFKNPQSFWISRSTEPDRPQRLIFTSTLNGVRNAYETDLQLRSPRPLSHFGSYATNAIWDAGAGQYLATQISSRGNQIVSFPASERERLPEKLPVIEALWQGRYPAVTSVSEPKVALSEISSDYSPWGYLWPRYWLPFFNFGPDGFLGSVQTSGQDPLAKHVYAINALYDSAIQKPSLIASYTNHSFFPSHRFSFYDISTRLADPTMIARTQVAQVSSSWEIQSVSPDLFVSVGATGIHREKFGFESDQAGPFVGLGYTNATRSGFQISPESGFETSLIVSSKRDQTLGRQNSSGEGSLTHYFSRWIPRRHAIMTKISGRYTDEIMRLESLDSSVADLTTQATPAGSYLMRGYPTGTFLGTSIAALNMEYRFPITRLDKAPDLYPFYLHQAYGAVVLDAIMMDGYVYNTTFTPKVFQRSEWGYGYANAGFEAKFEANIGYHVPLIFVTGLYWPLNSKISKSQPMWGLGIQL